MTTTTATKRKKFRHVGTRLVCVEKKKLDGVCEVQTVDYL